MTGNPDVWVSPGDEGWRVHRPGAGRDSSHHDTQAEAIRRATEIAKRERVDLVVRGRDGQIRSKDSYGNDPPRRHDREH